MQESRLVGIVSNAVSNALGEDGHQYKAGDRIYIGDSNVNHIKRRHSYTYLKYGNILSQIISEPNFVGINDEDGSLEYVKILDEHVKLVVRVAGDDKLYVRSMYTVYQSRTEYYVKSGRLKPLTKED